MPLPKTHLLGGETLVGLIHACQIPAMDDINPTHLIGPREQLAYLDRRSIELPVAISPLEAWNLMMAQPLPLLKAAFWLRDAISAWFGVKRIGGFTRQHRASVQVGDHLDFFLVEGVTSDALLLTERDKHLDVMTCISTQGNRLIITSSVVVHNGFGRAYMLPVGQAHKWVVQNMLTRLRRSLSV